jgi:hypothetical protein
LQWHPTQTFHDPNPPLPIGADALGYDGLGSQNAPAPQLVLVQGDEDAQRVQHHNRLFFGRPQVAAAAQPQRLPFMQKVGALVAGLLLFEQAAFATVDHSKLHRFRSPQASGHFLLPVTRIIPFGATEDARRIDHYSRLFFGRGGVVQQVGQPWLTWKRARSDQAVEEFTPARKSDLHLYRVGFQTVGQPNLYRFPKAKAGQDTELVDARVDHTRLHRYRVGYQTVGQPWALWGRQRRQDDLEQQAIYRAVDLTPFRGQYPAVVGQPWYLWPKAKAEQWIEPDAVRGDHTLLHLYRTGYQTVGQPWTTWPRRQTGIDAEGQQQAKPVDLTPYRGQYPAAAGAGQPWYLWPTAEAWQDVEPDATRTDHYRRLFFGRQAQGGHFLLPFTQLVLVGEDRDAQRVDHYRAMFGRATPVVAQPSQPFFVLWPQTKSPLEAEPEFRRSIHDGLHRYRVGYQTVGQPWLLWRRSARLDDIEPIVATRPIDLTPLRGQYPAVVVGQPWYLWPRAEADQWIEADAVRDDHNARLLFGRATPTAGPGQPWYFWKQQFGSQAIEPDARRNDYTSVFYYRTEIVIPPGGTDHEWMIRHRRRHRR